MFYGVTRRKGQWKKGGEKECKVGRKETTPEPTIGEVVPDTYFGIGRGLGGMVNQKRENSKIFVVNLKTNHRGKQREPEDRAKRGQEGFGKRF